MNAAVDQQQAAQRAGLLAALAAYVSWGLMPIFFKLLAAVDPWEIIAHRVVWAIPVLLLFLALRDGRACWSKLSSTGRGIRQEQGTYCCCALSASASPTIAVFRHGLSEGFYAVASVIAGSHPRLPQISPRRVYAIARLAVKESSCRRVIVAFAVFLIVLRTPVGLLDVDSDDPAKLFMLFVINATTYLMLVLLCS